MFKLHSIAYYVKLELRSFVGREILFSQLFVC